jgi:hypothetical protein
VAIKQCALETIIKLGTQDLFVETFLTPERARNMEDI